MKLSWIGYFHEIKFCLNSWWLWVRITSNNTLYKLTSLSTQETFQDYGSSFFLKILKIILMEKYFTVTCVWALFVIYISLTVLVTFEFWYIDVVLKLPSNPQCCRVTCMLFLLCYCAWSVDLSLILFLGGADSEASYRKYIVCVSVTFTCPQQINSHWRLFSSSLINKYWKLYFWRRCKNKHKIYIKKLDITLKVWLWIYINWDIHTFIGGEEPILSYEAVVQQECK